ncbi:HD domain-containing protein [soil metagenome]
MTTNPSFASVDELLAVLRSRSGRLPPPSAGGPPAERVSALDHHLQCAHQLRLEHPEDPELQVAGLVHDVGHVLAPGAEAGHGRIGAHAVCALLGKRVARLVELHVPAKRYLTAIDPDYRRRLSPASTATLIAQGGTMDPDEVAAFGTDPDASAALVLRSADEAAKVPGLATPDLEAWVPVLEAVAAEAGSRPASPSSHQ